MLPTSVRSAVPICISILGVTASASVPWVEKPAFTASPEEILRTSALLQARAGFATQELLEDYHVTLDEAGRRTARYRYIFRVDQESAIEGWGTVTAEYTTWIEDKPIIRARVITPDGKEHYLDSSTIGEFSPEQQSPDMFTDRRHLKAPLPKLVKGSIAEVEILSHDHRPFSRSGSLGSFSLSQPVPVNLSRYVLDAPASAPLKWKLKGELNSQPRSQTIDGRTLITVELGPTQPRRKDEPNQAPDQRPQPVLIYSTTPTWAGAAAEYAEIVEAQLRNPQVKSWVQKATSGLADRTEILKRLVAQMHKDVRYTGLEFGEASVVPRPPHETLKRGYGDCKDKSTLLVAVLREVGIQAHLALLRVGSRQDVDPEMPGLSGFDHAIVYLPGSPGIWIDPTVPEAQVGILPVADLERNALIIGHPGLNLQSTPSTTSDINVSREVKEVFLAEEGPGRIVETTEASGQSEIQLRSDYAGVDPKRTRENIKNYVDRTYKAKELGSLDYLQPEDLNRPFRLVMEAQKAGIANTGTNDASVAMNAWPLVSGLLNQLKPDPTEAEDENETESPKDPKKPEAVIPRKSDLLLWAPYAMEAKWVIHPPVGYANDTLPSDQSVVIGPARLTMNYKGNPDGSVEALYRMDCPKRRWNPKEVDQARASLKTFGESKIPLLVFQQVGEAFLGARKTKEALSEFRKLQITSPKSSDPLTRLARAQLAAGLAETARNSLKEAIRLEPNRSYTYQLQGWALQHDWIGRRFKQGWDRKGAIDSYRRAIALDSKNRFAKQNLAILLEHNLDGERYASGSDLAEAVKINQELVAQEKDDSIQDNLMICLAKQGRFSEAQEVARARDAAPRRNAWVIGMEACLNGQDKAIALGRSMFPELSSRRAAYLGAAEIAVQFRKYQEASALLNEGASGASDMTQVKARAEILARVRPYESIQLDFKKPQDVVQAMFLTLGERALTNERLKAFVSEANLTPHQLEKSIKEQRSFAASVAKQGGSIPMMLDITTSLTDITADGDDEHGYKVRAELQGQNPTTYYAIRSGGSYRLVGNELPDLARQAMWYLNHGNLSSASLWLNKLTEESRKPADDEPLSGHVIRRVWEKGRQGTESDIKLAAMCVLAMEKEEQEAAKFVRAILNSNLSKAQLGALAQSAILGATARKDRETQDFASAKLLELFPDSAIALRRRAESLIYSGNWQSALEVVEAGIKKHPENSDFHGNKAYLLNQLGRYSESDALLLDRVSKGKATPSDFNNLAWWRVVRRKVDTQTLDYARRSILGTGANSSAAHHTLATVLAESGRPAEAMEYLLKALGMREEEKPTGSDWYLLGCIAQQLGETAAARTYFRRVEPDRTDIDEGVGGCLAMAKHKLEEFRQSKNQ